MTRRILIRPLASQDLDDLFDYIAQNNPDAALRFFDATRQTISRDWHKLRAWVAPTESTIPV